MFSKLLLLLLSLWQMLRHHQAMADEVDVRMRTRGMVHQILNPGDVKISHRVTEARQERFNYILYKLTFR